MSKCPVCVKTVYPLEAQTYDGVDYHKTCFKCLQCKSVMGISSVAKIKGDLYCRPCFKKIFTEKGSYASFGAKTLAKNAPVKDLIASGQFDDSMSSPRACDTPSTPVSTTTTFQQAAQVEAQPAPIAEVEVKAQPAPVAEDKEDKIAELVVQVVAEAEAAAAVEEETPVVETEKRVAPIVADLVVEDAPVVKSPVASASAAFASLERSSVSSPTVSSPSFGSPSPKCGVCTKTVYPMELQSYDEASYHKNCFKCLQCKSIMGISSVAKIKGDLYCKPCFKKIFKEKGSYASFGAKTLAKNAPVKDLIASGVQSPINE